MSFYMDVVRWLEWKKTCKYSSTGVRAAMSYVELQLETKNIPLNAKLVQLFSRRLQRQIKVMGNFQFPRNLAVSHQHSVLDSLAINAGIQKAQINLWVSECFFTGFCERGVAVWDGKGKDGHVKTQDPPSMAGCWQKAEPGAPRAVCSLCCREHRGWARPKVREHSQKMSGRCFHWPVSLQNLRTGFSVLLWRMIIIFVLFSLSGRRYTLSFQLNITLWRKYIWWVQVSVCAHNTQNSAGTAQIPYQNPNPDFDRKILIFEASVQI